MSKGIETMRELNAAELDQVGGGLSLGLGLSVDAGAELKAVGGLVSGLVDQVGGLVKDLAGGALGAVGGLAGGVLGKV